MALPLAGVRVLDLSRLLPGPFCSLLLADYGADVIKVEDTGMGDYVRWAIPKYEGGDESAASAYFLALNRGKRSIRVGLEDNFYLPDGTMARSNGDLIAKARQMAEDIGRRPATVAEARELLDVPRRELTRREVLTGDAT